MNTKKSRHSLASGLWGWLKFSLVAGGLVWGALYLAFRFIGRVWLDVISLGPLGTAIAVAASLMGLGVVVELLRSGAAREDARLARERLARTEAAKATAETQRLLETKTRVQTNLTSSLNSIPGQAIADYRDAAEWLASTAHYARSAEDHFQESSYSPFWETVEHGYESLSNFRNAMVRVSDLAQAYSQGFTEIDVAFLESQELPTEFQRFPFEISESNLEPESLRIEEYLHSVVQQAQKDYSFASIYEQRRTTSAVIQGFGSLSSAIQYMSSSIASSLEECSQGISAAAAETNHLLDRAHGSGSDFRPNSISYEVRSIGRQLESVVSSLK